MSITEERDKFMSIAKLILKRKLSKNPVTLEGYRGKIIEAYDDFAVFCEINYDDCLPDQRKIIDTHYAYIVRKFARCLRNLNCNHPLRFKQFELIDESTIQFFKNFDEENVLGEEYFSSDNSNSESVDNTVTSNPDANNLESCSSEPENKTIKMAYDPTAFFNTCKSVLNTDFKGDPLELDAFVNKVQMLTTLAVLPNDVTLLYSFVKTKLSGKALEATKQTDITTDLLIASLRAKIKPESSNVIKGKLTALRLANKSFQTFATEIEELSDAFKRSLIVEGFPEEKAIELTIEKTVEVCRNSAHSDIVKSVIASSKFATPKEAIAKFITETDTNKVERQVLALRQFQVQARRGNNHSRDNGRGYQHNNGRSGQQFNHLRQDNQRQYNGNNFRGNNFRGNNFRGNYRGRFNNNKGHQNNYPNRNYHQNQNFGQQNSNIRVTQSGNEVDPRQMPMGGPNSQTHNGQLI